MKQKILRILPFVTTVLIMILIFCLSSQTREESAALSSGVTKRIVDIVLPHTSPEKKADYMKMLHNTIRKCAHFVLYASLGFSAAGMFATFQRKNHRIWLGAVILCALYAVTDEFHQSMVAGRGPQVSDVVLDAFGGGFGAGLFLIFLMLYRKGKDKRYD